MPFVTQCHKTKLVSPLPVESCLVFFLPEVSRYVNQPCDFSGEEHWRRKFVYISQRSPTQQKISWNNASVVCRIVDTTIPQVYSKSDFHEILYFIHTSSLTPVVAGVFVWNKLYVLVSSAVICCNSTQNMSTHPTAVR